MQRLVIMGSGHRLPGLHLRHDPFAPGSNERKRAHRKEAVNKRLQPLDPKLQRQTRPGHSPIKRLQEHFLDDNRQARSLIVTEHKEPI